MPYRKFLKTTILLLSSGKFTLLIIFLNNFSIIPNESVTSNEYYRHVKIYIFCDKKILQFYLQKTILKRHDFCI